MAPYTFLLTRPLEQSQRFADLLRKRIGAGAHIVIAPVLRIAFRPIAAEALAARGFVFTSENGVRAVTHAGGLGQGRRAWCVGPRTAEAAEAAGFVTVNAGGDAETLVAMLSDAKPATQLCHVHGAHVAGDVGGRLQAAGLTVCSVVGYEQRAADLDPAARRLLAGARPLIAPVFSPRSARLLAPDLASATAPVSLAALSRSVAAALAEEGLWPLRIAATPDAAAMVSLLADMIGARRT